MANARRVLVADRNESMQARIADITLIEEPVQPPNTMGAGALDRILVRLNYDQNQTWDLVRKLN